jgi:membrane protease YdiL (CAAX protease family)
MEHPAAIPPAPPRPYTWRYTDNLLVFAGGLFGGLVAGLFVLAATGETTTVPASWLFWVVLPAQFMGSLLTLWVISRARGTGSFERDFGFELNPRDFPYVPVGMLVLVATGLIAAGIRLVLGLGDENPQGLIEIVDQVGEGSTQIAMVLGLVLLGPITEELAYRGLLLRTLLERTGERTAITVSAIIFSAVHVTDPALLSLDGVPTLSALLLMGVVLAWVTVRSGSLSRAIFIHSGFNLLTTISLLVTDAEMLEETTGAVAHLFGR